MTDPDSLLIKAQQAADNGNMDQAAEHVQAYRSHDCNWTGEQVSGDLERWLKARREQYTKHTVCWRVVDVLLDEVREAGVEGWLPWQRMR